MRHELRRQAAPLMGSRVSRLFTLEVCPGLASLEINMKTGSTGLSPIWTACGGQQARNRKKTHTHREKEPGREVHETTTS